MNEDMKIIARELQEIAMRASRHQRGTDLKKYLIMDLENIYERTVKALQYLPNSHPQLSELDTTELK